MTLPRTVGEAVWLTVDLVILFTVSPFVLLHAYTLTLFLTL